MWGHIIVSYADTGMGHIGIVYQACNFIYTGCTKERTDIGNNKENGHSRHYDKSQDYSINRKVRTAKYRYIFFSGSKSMKKKWRSAFKYKSEPYPTGESKRYNASANIIKQDILF